MFKIFMSNLKVIGLFFGYSMLMVYKQLRGKLTRAEFTRLFHVGVLRGLRTTKISYRVFQDGKKSQLQSDKVYIYMSNHQSFVDIALIPALIPGHVRFLAKKSLLYWPIFGNALRASESICVDLRNPEKNVAQFKEAKKKLESGIRLCIFPEGQRSYDGKLLPLKAGGFRLAREMNAMIIPLGIRGTGKLLPRGKLFSNYEEGKNLELHVGEPIDVSQYSVIHQKELMQKVAHEIKRLSGSE